MTKRKNPSLRAFRKKHGLSMKQVAKAVGINIVTVWRIENKVVEPRGLTQRALTQFMTDYATAAQQPSA